MPVKDSLHLEDQGVPLDLRMGECDECVYVIPQQGLVCPANELYVPRH
jgi:hypothetical protein